MFEISYPIGLVLIVIILVLCLEIVLSAKNNTTQKAQISMLTDTLANTMVQLSDAKAENRKVENKKIEAPKPKIFPNSEFDRPMSIIFDDNGVYIGVGNQLGKNDVVYYKYEKTVHWNASEIVGRDVK